MTKKNETRESAGTGFLDRVLALKKANRRLVEPLQHRIYTIERVLENTLATLALSDLQTRLVNFYSSEHNPQGSWIMAPNMPFEVSSGPYGFGRSEIVCPSPEIDLAEGLSFFAKRGDLLCVAIQKYADAFDPDKYFVPSPLYSSRYGEKYCGGSKNYLNLLSNHSSDIRTIGKLVEREMTEQEYFGMLNGKMPFAKDIREVLHYLPKPTEETK